MTPRGTRVYCALLRLLPRDFRRDAGRELVEVFVAARARARERGGVALAAFWARTLLDLAVTASAEHAARRRSRRTPAVAFLPHGDAMRTTSRLSIALADLGLAFRLLWKTPGWTVIASGTLALGIGALVLTGVLMRDVILRPLPMPDAERLVRVIEISDDGRGWWPSYPNARDWREHARALDIVGIIGSTQIRPAVFEGEALRARVGGAGADVLSMLGAHVETGRLFLDVEHRADGTPVAVVAERFWRTQLGARAPRDLAVTIGDVRYQIVGVLQAGFNSPGDAGAWQDGPDVWLPLEQQGPFGNRTSHGGFHVIARLAEGTTLDAARLQMDDLARTLKQTHGELTQADRLRLTPLHDIVVGGAREPLRLLWYAGMGVLLVACLNLSAALLAQGLTRQRELAIRGALGATRARIAGHLLAGASVLAVPATLAGIALGAAGLRVVKRFAAGIWPRLDEATLDWQAVGIALAIAAVTALVAGLLPALMLSARAGRDSLRSRGATGGAHDSRVWTSFVAGEVALTLLLLVGSGLLARSFIAAASVDLGFEPADVVVVDVRLPMPRYEDPGRRVAFYGDLLDRMRGIAGVSHVGMTSVLPHEPSAYTASTRIDGTDEEAVMAGYRLVDPGYFAAIGIPVLTGDARALEAGQALVDRRLSSQLWQTASPVGTRVRNSFDAEPLDVAGIVGTVREWNEGDETTGAVYVAYRRQPITNMTMVLRHEPGFAPSVSADARQVLRAVDPLVPVRVEPYAPRVAEALHGQRLLVAIATFFGAIALLLAAAGVYAMIAFAVARRAREAAIRLALGAQPGSLGVRVVLQGVRPAAIGAAAGLLLTAPLANALRAQLFQVSGRDAFVLTAATAAIVLAAAAASIVPARRFSRVDPLGSLREDAS